MTDRTSPGTDMRPLRFVNDAAYERLTTAFRDRNLQVYDVQAEANWEDGDVLVIRLRYGEGMRKQRTESFTSEELAEGGANRLTAFLTDTAEDCRKAAIADYYRLITP